MTDVEEFVIDPRIEKTVWKSLGLKPLKQIADETGLSRDQIIRIREELLSSVDDLTIMQKRQKLIIELESLAYEARDRAQSMADEFVAGTLNASVGAIKAVQAELARMARDDSSKIEALNSLRRREIVQMYISVVDSGVEEIAAEHDLDADALFSVFNRLLEEYAKGQDALV